MTLINDAPGHPGSAGVHRPQRRTSAAARLILAATAAGLLSSCAAAPPMSQATIAQAPSVAVASSPAVDGTDPASPPENGSSSAAGSGTGRTKDVTEVGMSEGGGASPVSTFTSPSGNLICNLSSHEISCGATKYDADLKRPCPDGPYKAQYVFVLNYPQVQPYRPASWGCMPEGNSGDPLLDEASYTDWWDPIIGTTVRIRDGEKMSPAAALRYGNTLIAGDNQCTMAKDGVTCKNPVTGHGFHLNKAGAQLY